MLDSQHRQWRPLGNDMPCVDMYLPVGSREDIPNVRLKGVPHKFDYWVSAPLEVIKMQVSSILVSLIFSRSSKKSCTLVVRRLWAECACSSCSVWETTDTSIRLIWRTISEAYACLHVCFYILKLAFGQTKPPYWSYH